MCVVMMIGIKIFYILFFFFFNDTATTEIYTLSLHDALPICGCGDQLPDGGRWAAGHAAGQVPERDRHAGRSEEHTSELQSQSNLVCRLLLEKKKKKPFNRTSKTPPCILFP